MKTVQEIRPIKRTAETDLLKRSGVTGVDIGYKFVKGKKIDKLAIRVYVEKKKDVHRDELIPKSIQGVKTDVIERKFVLHPLMLKVADLELKADTDNYDPLKGGISIGPCRSIYLTAEEATCQGAPGAGWYFFVGTLGVFVRDNTTNAEMMLSNFHVMCVNDNWSVGDTMAQPSRVDGGSCPADVVGTLQRAALGGHVDCAVANHTARDFECAIIDIGTVTGTTTAAEGMDVRKRGRTTGLTYGIVDTVDLSVNIDYCDGFGTVTLSDQIGIEVDLAQSAQFGDNGDSGSVVVNNSRKVVGLYFAGNEEGTYGVANPIQAVLDELDVMICESEPKKYEYEYEKWPWSEIERYKPEQLKPEQLKPEQHKPEQLKPEQLKPEQHKPEQLKPEQYKSEQYKSEQYKPEQLKRGETPPMGSAAPASGGSVEERLSRIEATLAQLTHFIHPNLRPDLRKGALYNEPDQG